MKFFTNIWQSLVHSRTRSVGFLILLCLILYLPGSWTLPPFDRDEARYAQASKQMIESGDYTTINFQDSARNKKPVGIYWLQAASVSALDSAKSFHIFFFRVPSLLCGIIAVLGFYFLLLPALTSELALFSSVILATTVSAVSEAHLATTDAALLLCSVLCMTPLMHLWLKRGAATVSLPLALLFWAALGAGTLVKGPVLPAVVGAASLLYSFRARSLAWFLKLRPLIGIPVTLAIVLPWFIAIQAQTEGAFVSEAFKGDILPKLVGVHESHRGFPGYYTLSSLVSFWPWSFLLAPTVVFGYRQRKDSEIFPWLCWLVPAWVGLELVPTKLPHYSLPLFPALAVLAAKTFYEINSEELTGRFTTIIGKVAKLIGIVLGIALIAAPIYFSQNVSFVSLLGGSAVTLIGLTVLFKRLPDPLLREAALLQAAIFYPILFAFTLPELGSFWSSKILTEKVTELRAEIKSGKITPAIASAGYQEPSFVFLNGTHTLLTDGKGAAEFLHTHCPAIVFVADREREAFADRSAELEEHPIFTDPIRVFNYSKGKWLNIVAADRSGCE